MGEAVRVVDGGWRAAVLLTEMAVVFVGRPHASCSCTVALAGGSARACPSHAARCQLLHAAPLCLSNNTDIDCW